ncbi:NADH-quinone oxidoreductase subunit N [Paenibacillus arenilitoris]|uniref:NADH-quinone oxidoreductase subunit N n=1 Tax=Paenibacillus arenilitoris TaxID=2772299 RepID=A0A927CHU4_9BACL|nr:NADH-quinone oxidoreductase subunit N [Paenibacillus arenilitoris]MBD2868364.1 NADH-quinone oxidoreductase subunit N [Paenibacillus arenilitoris]
MFEGASFTPLTWTDMLYLAPELALAAVFLLLVAIDLLLPNKFGRTSIGWLTLAGLLASLGLVLWRMLDMNQGGAEAETIQLLANSYRIDDFASLLKIVFLAGASLIVLLALGTVRDDGEITDKGEFFYLLLPAAIGAMTMASSGNLVTLYIGLELLSLTSYVLVGMKRRSALSPEAAFKYLVLGGISSAFVLFGMSYIYGVTGSVDLAVIYQALPAALADYKALVYVGFLFMVAGFGIKIAAAPFHAWAPDVYQGAPTPVAAFLAVVAKGAAMAALFRIMFGAVYFARTGEDADVAGDIFLTLLVMAAAAMLAGTTAALRQKNVKRLLALSGVANAGYLLVPIGVSITIVHSSSFSEFVYYLVAYFFMTIGAFAVFAVVSRAAGHEELKGFAGMYYRSPWTAAAMVVFVLSLAGLPVSGGFFGKLFILFGAANAKAYWLVGIIVVSSVISYYFYFGLVRQMFMRSGAADQPIPVPVTAGIVIWLCAVATLALGAFPGPLMGWIDSVFSIGRDLLFVPFS